MRILKISAGLPPKRTGGVPAYLIDLRQELIQRGYEIIYLNCDGRDHTRQARIVQTGVSPNDFTFYNTGAKIPWEPPRANPLSDIYASEASEKVLLEFLDRQKPDLIHFHEVLGFPLELVSKLRSAGYKLIFTAEDFFTVCPTIQLLRHDLKVCTLQARELQCRRCVANQPNACRSAFMDQTSRALVKRGGKWPLIASVLRRLDSVCGVVVGRGLHSAGSYQERRLEALTHLRSFHAILFMSKAQHELFVKIAGQLPNGRQIYLSRTTYGSRQPRLAKTTNQPLQFISLNINQTSKGRDLLLREFASLRAEIDSVVLHIFGSPRTDQPGVFWHGSYSSADLDSILATMDVGIIPSIWPEAYGFVGPEMLTRGVPVIASSIGAMKEYVTAGFNGLIFDPDQPGSLKEAMKMLVVDRNLLARLGANAADSNAGLISFANHVDEMEAIYEEVSTLRS